MARSRKPRDGPTVVSMDDAIEAKPRPCWIAGNPEEGPTELVVRHPYDGTEVASVSVPGPDQVERAVAAAASVATQFRSSPAHLRAAALMHVSQQLAARHEEISE